MDLETISSKRKKEVHQEKRGPPSKREKERKVVTARKGVTAKRDRERWSSPLSVVLSFAS